MIKTTLEWYTLDEKLPFDGNNFTENEYAEVLCSIRHNWETVEVFRYLNGRFVIYYDGELVDFTDDVLYWTYVPNLKEE
jgi:hypothetical protein